VSDVKDPRRERYNSLRQVGYLTTIPFLLVASPLIGWWLGRLLDRLLHTTFLTWVFLALGMVAGIREVVRVIRRATSSDDPDIR
jgi:F0F1-type ATP synthase assembly protein I